MGKRYGTYFNKLFHKFKTGDTDLRLRQLAESDKPLSIRLTNDFAFKKTFRNKIALTGFLSCLLHISPEEIVDLEFPDPFVHGEFIENHEGILDVKVHLNHSQKINIEIQVLSYTYWEERSLFYLCKMYAEDFVKGQDYGALEDCVHISILGFPLEGAEHLYSVFRLMDEESGHIYSSKLSLRVLYLSKLDTCSEEDRCTEIYHWAKLISAQDWRVLNEMAKRNKYMKEAVEEMERLNADKELRYLYLMRLKAASDKATMRNYYEKIERDALEAQKGMEAALKKLDSANAELDAARKSLKTKHLEGFREGQTLGIRVLIEDGLEDGKTRAEIIRRLQKRFSLAESEAAVYFDKYGR